MKFSKVAVFGLALCCGLWSQAAVSTVFAEPTAVDAGLVEGGGACIRIDVPQEGDEDFRPLAGIFALYITINRGQNSEPEIILQRGVVAEDGPHVIYNLPANTEVIISPLIFRDFPRGIFVVNSGAPMTPSTPNPPEFPFNACRAEVTVYSDYATTPPFPEEPENVFLHGVSTFASTRLLQDADGNLDRQDELTRRLDNATTQYYNLVDPRGLRTTLDDFKKINAVGGQEVNVAYANSADLGFGRNMSAVKTRASDGKSDYAFFVNNYGSYTTDDEADFRQAVQNDPNNRVATVAMEFSRIEDATAADSAITYSDPERVTKFFVYDGDGNLVNNADLDGFGSAPIPQLCVVCHGGTMPYPGADPDKITDGDVPVFGSRDSVKMGSLFIPFVLADYTIVDGFNPDFDKAAQQGAFKELNELVLETNPGEASTEVIEAMYANGSSEQIDRIVVPGWAGSPAQAAFYRDMIAPACRTCHLARPVQPDKDIRLNNADEFAKNAANVELRVCKNYEMPHSLASFNRFWGSREADQPALSPLPGVQLLAYGRAYINPNFGDDCIAPTFRAVINE